MIKKGCSSVIFRKYDLDRAMEAMREAGYEYFETHATGPYCDHINLDRDDPIKWADHVKSFGFKGVTSVWSPRGSLIANGDDCVPVNARLLEWAGAAGIGAVDFGDGHKPKDMSIEDAFQRLSDRVQELTEVAAKNNVIFALEPHGTFSLSLAGLQKILSISDSPYFGINYDCANLSRLSIHSEGPDPEADLFGSDPKEVAVLKKIVDRVVHFHAKDMSEERKCVALGTGIVDVVSCIEVLKNAGYEGVVSYETEGSEEYDEAFEMVSKSSKFLDKHLFG